MKLFTIIFERLPMVWFLLGLLFNSAGLYLGFENSLSFGYMIVGCFCCAYGLALLVFRYQERPRSSAATRLSPDFMSVGGTEEMSMTPEVENRQTTERSNVEEKAP